MADFITEAHTCASQTDTRAFDGYAGFRIGQRYVLRFARLDHERVSLELDHAPEAGRQLVVSWAELERWWVKD